MCATRPLKREGLAFHGAGLGLVDLSTLGREVALALALPPSSGSSIPSDSLTRFEEGGISSRLVCVILSCSLSRHTPTTYPIPPPSPSFLFIPSPVLPPSPSMATRKLISSNSPFETQIGYSRAVVAGDLVFVSGCTGYVPSSSCVLISFIYIIYIYIYIYPRTPAMLLKCWRAPWPGSGPLADGRTGGRAAQTVN